MAKVTFNKTDNSFYNALKSDIDAYFKSNNIKKTGNWRLYSKAIFLMTLAVSLYIILIFTTIPVWQGILFSAILGLTLASIGFNVMHDACHGSFSSKSWVNNVLGLTLNAMGGNAFIWKQKHNIIHHTYTNVDGIDDDIAKSPLMRQCSTQKWVPAHKFQHIYVLLIYAISSFAWVFIMDFNKYLSRRIFRTPIQKMSTADHLTFWLSKALYVLFYVAIPIYFVGLGPWAIGFTVMHVAMGFALAIVFQLAHVVEITEFEEAKNEVNFVDQNWAEHQVRTTADFARKSKLVSWYVGGLNFQIEHHLFPRVSHIHYPEISEIVKANCIKFNLPYNEYSKMSEAVASHFRIMKQFGEKPAELAAA